MNSGAAALPRRRFLQSTAALAAAAALPMPAWARGLTEARRDLDDVSGGDIRLTVAPGRFSTGGRSGHAVTVNGGVPGPLVRLREGQDVRLHVTNRLNEDTSIHWHGLLVPFQFDGVPGVSFPGIKPGETFTYEFPVRQAGTYWWHSHSGLQEQSGLYGPLIVDPAGVDPVSSDREYVLLLSEFTPHHPHWIMRRLKQEEGYFDYQKTTLTSGDMPLSERMRWGRMRMSPTDILDVTGAEYTYLVNGHGPGDGLSLLFRPGERVRLRIINGSAMTFFNVRLPGLPMTVVQADGQDVTPVEVDELQIGTAETYDVVVTPAAAVSFIAEAMDRSGMAHATLTPRPGTPLTPPALRERPLLTMRDMGMAGMADHAATGHAAGMSHDMRDTSALPPDVEAGSGVDMVAANPVDRMGDPGIGLERMPHRVLTYRDLRSLRSNKTPREPGREMEIHLTGNMERYMWSFDGRKFSALDDRPVRFAYNERVRVKLVNNTMMAHPIHLHGHFFELVNGADTADQPLKHTLIVQPGGTATFDLTADEPGDWAFHCHLLYHMHAGMFQVVTVRPLPQPAA